MDWNTNAAACDVADSEDSGVRIKWDQSVVQKVDRLMKAIPPEAWEAYERIKLRGPRNSR
ncbi:MAG TPA: hypothetical protein VHL34_07145 [Rhizomicrobium sp.]|jgi:hypothetical protein|nr:hypothetical protein [Rhizomicrobium sp.]